MLKERAMITEWNTRRGEEEEGTESEASQGEPMQGEPTKKEDTENVPLLRVSALLEGGAAQEAAG